MSDRTWFWYGTVTSNHAEMILEMEATGSPLMEYISRTRNNWTLPVFDTIDWNVHCNMLKRMNKWRSHSIKFLHDGMHPTLSRLIEDAMAENVRAPHDVAE